MIGIITTLCLVGLIGYAKYDRNKRYDTTCPRCGKICHPHTTGLMDGRTHLTKYKYKCSCGWRSS